MTYSMVFLGKGPTIFASDTYISADNVVYRVDSGYYREMDHEKSYHERKIRFRDGFVYSFYGSTAKADDVYDRLIGIIGNASSLNDSDLDKIKSHIVKQNKEFGCYFTPNGNFDDVFKAQMDENGLCSIKKIKIFDSMGHGSKIFDQPEFKNPLNKFHDRLRTCDDLLNSAISMTMNNEKRIIGKQIVKASEEGINEIFFSSQ